MSTLKLTVSQWMHLRAELQTEYPKTVFMIRDKMKTVLGFTVREHSGYRPRTPKELEDYDRSDVEWYSEESQRRFHRDNKHEHSICLDFYNERKYTMFLLKYSEMINDRR